MKKLSAAALRDLLGDLDDGLDGAALPSEATALLAKAEEALADYDFEASHGLLRRALLASGGDLKVATRLLAFLVDEYGQFEAAARLFVGGPWGEDPAVLRLGLTALAELGRDQDFAIHLEAAPEAALDAPTWARAGAVYLRLQAFDRAAAAFRRALTLNQALSEAQAGLAQAERQLLAAQAPLLARLDELLASGQGAAALTLLEQQPLAHLPPELLARRRRAQDLANAAQAEAALTRALAAEDARDLDGALAAYREVLALDPTCRSASEKLEELEQRRRRSELDAALQRADALAAEGRLEEALASLQRAQRLGLARVEFLARRPAPELALGLHFLETEDRLPNAAQAAALGLLARALEASPQAPLEDLERDLRSIERALGAFGPAEPLRQRVDALRAAAREAEARRLLEAAATLPDAQALEQYRRALDLHPALGPELARTLERLEKKLGAREALEARVSEARNLAERERWFPLLELLSRNPMVASFSPEIAAAATKARSVIAQQYSFSVEPGEQRPLTSPCRFSSRDRDNRELAPLKTMVFPGLAGDAMLLVDGTRALCVNPDSCSPLWKATLPPAAEFKPGKNLLLHSSEGGRDLFCTVDPEADAFFLFEAPAPSGLPSGLAPVNAGRLSQFLAYSKGSIPRSFMLDGPTLVILETGQSPGAESVVRGVNLQSGELQFETRHPFGLTGLAPIRGLDRWRSNRLFDPGAWQRRSWFSFAELDHRGRIAEKHFLKPEELDGTIAEGVLAMTWSPSAQMLFFFTRFLEPITGQVLATPPAFGAMRRNKELFYASSDGNAVMRKRGTEVLGRLGLVCHPEGDTLLIPARGPAGLELGLFNAADLEKRHSVELGPDTETLRLLHSRDRSRMWVFATFQQGNLFSIRELDARQGRFLA